MEPKDVESLKVGDRVRHTDGTAGTITDVAVSVAVRQACHFHARQRFLPGW